MSYLNPFELLKLSKTSKTFRNDMIWKILFNEKFKGIQLTDDFLWHDFYFQRIQAISESISDNAQKT
jgi:hypothetical protein